MSAPVFLVSSGTLSVFDAGDPRTHAGASLVLDGAEGRHAATVRRLRAAEELDLTDGAGRRARCVVRTASPDRLDLEVRAFLREPAPSPRLVVVQALAKGDRAEQAVEILTEVGADVIVPWAASRSVVQWHAERGEKALRRWQSTAREAAKQSRRAWLPEVTDPASTAEVGRLLAGAALAVVLHEEADSPLAEVAVPATGDVVVVVGPEGGISSEELAAFTAAGAAAYRLGPTVMRTSTAGAAACAVLLAASPRWRG